MFRALVRASGGHRIGRGLRRATWLLLALSALLVPLTVQSQDPELDPVLVSNTGQTAGAALATTSEYATYAQSFRTGDHPDGYYLTSVDLGLAVGEGVSVKVELWLATSSGDGADAFFQRTIADSLQFYDPSTEYYLDPRIGFYYRPGLESSEGAIPGHIVYSDRVLADLSLVGTTDEDAATLETFLAHDVLLEANSIYWIVVTQTAGDAGGLSVGKTTSGSASDGGGMEGFAVRPDVWGRAATVPNDGDRGWSAVAASGEESLTFRLRGSKIDDRPPGPYMTNRNQQPRAAVAEISGVGSRLATSFHTSQSVDFWSPTRRSYQLSSVLLSLSAESGTTPRVAIHADSNGSPAASPVANGTLTKPSVISADLAKPGRATFTASTAITLASDTTYWVVLDASSGTGKLSVSTTESNDRDVRTRFAIEDLWARGWAIGDTMKARSGSSWSDDADGRSFRMALNGPTDPHGGRVQLGVAQVGVGIRPFISDKSGRFKNESWQWRRGDTRGGTFTDIPASKGGTARDYVPSEADLDKWLRVTVTYEDAFGTGNTASGATVQPVLSEAAVSTAGRVNVFGYVVQSREDGQPFNLAQSFITGSNASGYLLSGLRFGLNIDTVVDELSWTLHADDQGKPAELPLFTPFVVDPGTLDQSMDTFEDLPHPGFPLQPSTKYWAVLTSSEIYADNDDGSLCPPQSPGDAISSVDDTQLTVQFKQAKYEVVEGCRVQVTVTLSKDPKRTIVIPIRTTGSDYSGVPPSITFNAGQTEEMFTLRAEQEEPNDGIHRSVSLSFGNLPSGVTEGTPAESQVTIYDDDRAFIGTAAIGEWGEQQVMEGAEAELDPESASGWSLPYTVLAKGDLKDVPVEWVPYSKALELQRSKHVLRMSVLLYPSVTVTLGAAEYDVDEGGTLEIAVSLDQDPERTVVVPIRASGLDGAEAEDFDVPESITFEPGETEKTLRFTATQDTVDDDDERVTLRLGPKLPDHVTALAPSETTIAINDDDDPEVEVSFGAAAYTAAEGGSATISVSLDADPERTLVIPVTQTLNDASAADFSGVPENLTFNAGETEKTITFAATDDAIDDDGESVTLGFGTMPDERVVAASPSATTVNIDDNDGSGVTVSKASVEVDEQGMNTYTIVLDSEPVANVAIAVTVTEPDGASGVEVDDNSLTFTASNWDTEQTITVSALHDDNVDDESALIVHASTSTDSNYNDAPVASVAVAVLDDDETLSFAEPTYEVDEGGTVKVVVRLSEDPEREVTIPIVVMPLDEASNDDYAEIPSSVTFNSGETERTITIVALDDTVLDDGEQVLIAFGDLPVGVYDGETLSSKVTIVDRCAEDELWCATMSLAQSRALGHGRSNTVTDEFDRHEFTHNDVLYGVKGILLNPLARSLSQEQASFASRTRATLDFIMWNLSGESPEEQWTMPNLDYRNWTLNVSTIVSEEKTLAASLPFGEAKYCCGTYWKWYGADLDALNEVWQSERLYRLSIVDDSRSQRSAALPGAPLFLELMGVNANSVVLRWTRPQTRNDQAPKRVLYKLQWKLVSGDWDTPEDVTTVPYTPSPGAELMAHMLYGLAPASEYHARVVASNAAGDGPPSPVVRFMTNALLSSSGQESANSPAQGVPGVDGLALPGETLTATTSGISDADGMTNAVFAYQWWRLSTSPGAAEESIPGATGPSYTLATEDGNHSIWVVVSFVDDAGNLESLPSNRYLALPPLNNFGLGLGGSKGPKGPGVEPRVELQGGEEEEDEESCDDESGASLTAQICDQPKSHDGATPFTFELRLSEEPQAGLSFRTIRDYVFTVVGGAIDGVSRLERGSSRRWRVAVRPSGDGVVTIVQLATVSNCESWRAICTADGRKLSTSQVLTVAGPTPTPPPKTPKTPETPETPEQTESVSAEFDPGEGQRLLAWARIAAGERGRKNDETQDRAWYAVDTSAWYGSGELREGSLAWNGMTVNRVVYFPETDVFRFNDAGSDFDIGRSFESGGVNRDLTIWVATESARVSFEAKRSIVNHGPSWINFLVPQPIRSTLDAINTGDVITIAVSAAEGE